MKLSFLRQVKYGFETAMVYCLYGFFYLMPLDVASDFGGWLLQGVGPWLGSSRVALKNLDLAFPEKSQTEKDKILVGMWNNLGRVIAEYPHLHRISSVVELVGAEHMESVRDNGKAALLFSGHIANWELPVIRHRTGLDIHVVYRKPNNPWVDRLLRHARKSGCIGQIEKGTEGTRKIVSVLRKDGIVGFLADQKLNEGMSIPFFGRGAMTAPAIAHFALKFKCPIYPFRIQRLSGCRFRVTAFPPLEVMETGHKEDDVREILTAINRMLENWIRETPEQWLWIHRRWPKDLYIGEA